MGLIDPRHHWLAPTMMARIPFERGRYVLGLTDLREPLFVRSRLAKRSVRDGNCWTEDRWTLRRDNNPVLGHTRSFLSGHEDCCHRRWQIRLRSHSQADVASIVTLQRRKRRTHDPFFRAQALPVCEGGVGMLCFSDFPQSDVGYTKAPDGMDHRLCPDELKEFGTCHDLGLQHGLPRPDGTAGASPAANSALEQR